MQRPQGNGNGTRRVLQFAAAIIGTILVSVATAFFAFGQQQQSSILRLEASEQEDARQREIDQALVKSLNDALQRALIRIGELETRIAVNEARIEQNETRIDQFIASQSQP